MRKRYLLLVAAAVFVMASSLNSYAGEIDILLDKLVDKGVLTAGEAQQVAAETKEDVRKEIAAGKSDALPKWVQNTKLKGDFRVRYQLDHAKAANNATSNRQRGRIRMRLGVESKVNEKLLVAVGMATGLNEYTTSNKDSIRSTNQSSGSSWAKKPFNLDYAYAKYTPMPGFAVIGGKMLLKDAIWEPGDLMWDTDITPEGVALDISKNINADTSVFLKTGVFFLEEVSASNDDPYSMHIQPGMDIKINDALSLRASVAGDYFSVRDFTLEGSSVSNTGSYKSGDNSYAVPMANYTNIMPALELKIADPFRAFNLNVPQLKLFGEYVRNIADIDPYTGKSGYMLGFNLGYDKLVKFGDWTLKYNYARLEKNAVLDILPDSDRYEGKTNIRAHELALDFGLGENTWLGLDIYRAQLLTHPHAPSTVVQVDWNMKF